MTLTDRHAALLNRAMLLSRERQDVEQRLRTLDQEMLKTAGQIELVEHLIADAATETTHGE